MWYAWLYFLHLFSCKLWALCFLLFNGASIVDGFSLGEYLVVSIFHFHFDGLQSKKRCKQTRWLDQTFNDLKKQSTWYSIVVWLFYFCWLWIWILGIVFGVKIIISIDGGKCPMIENCYDIVKLMNLYYTISFDGGIRSLEVIYKDRNHGCDEKPQGFWDWSNGNLVIMCGMFCWFWGLCVVAKRRMPIKMH